jgi:hypothetical protein
MIKRRFSTILLAASLARLAAGDDLRGDRLYRMTLLRAAPGRLLELIEEVKRVPQGRPAGPRLVLRHSQGDQWDLMVLTAIDSYASHLGSRTAPVVAPSLVAWVEDTFVRGPDLSRLEGFDSAKVYHVEMFHALADKRDELLKEREMENAYLRALGRPVNAIFTRELGGSWDAFTIGAYRGWKHFAEREDIPPEKSASAARAAGFESDDRIGPYLRSLIQSHHDTLATPVR